MASLEPGRKKIKLDHEQDTDSTLMSTSLESTSELELFTDWTNAYSNRIDSQNEDEEDMDDFELEFEENDSQNLSKPEDDDDTYSPMNRDQLLEFMNEKLAEVKEMHEDIGILRALMTHYKWQKERLLENFVAGKEKCFEELGIDLLEPKEEIDREQNVCCICIDSEREITSLACSHTVCENCLHEYIVNEIKKRESCIRCPQCKIPINESKVIEILGANTNEFQHNLIEGFVNTNPDIQWCTTPDTLCGRAIVVKNPEKVHTVICNCTNLFCFKCKNVAHEPLPCYLLTKWMEIMEDELNNTWVLQNSKPCPNCKTPIVKNGGCNDMKCANCGQSFCWICLECMTALSLPHLKCLFIVEDKSKPTLISEDIRDKVRFIFYQSRFYAHEQSFNLEKQLNDVLKYAKNGQNYEKEQYDFLEKALQTLTLSRNTLMWTFAFAYFIKPSNQLYIFEDNQAHLQKGTETLSGLIESKMKTPFGNINNIERNDFKINVLNATEYCKQRRNAMLCHAKDGTMEFEELANSNISQINTNQRYIQGFIEELLETFFVFVAMNVVVSLILG